MSARAARHASQLETSCLYPESMDFVGWATCYIEGGHMPHIMPCFSFLPRRGIYQEDIIRVE